MINTLFQIFLIGLSFSFSGPCFVSCAPILLPYFASAKENWKSAFLDILIFSFWRMTGYVFLTIVATVSMKFLEIFTGNFQIHIKTFFSVFVIIVALLIILGKEPNLKLCAILSEKLIVKTPLSIAVLGFLIGILPCAPLLGLVFEIALISKTVLSGVLYGIAFGIGTTISPLIILAPLSNYIPAKILKQEKTQKIFRIFCGILLLYLGIKYLFSPLPYQNFNF